ncbi:MAG: hypothetical protein WCT47_07750 [Betaproteobacteria bacterium]|jgi:hypothetical protein
MASQDLAPEALEGFAARLDGKPGLPRVSTLRHRRRSEVRLRS